MPAPRPNVRAEKPRAAFIWSAANPTLMRSRYATMYRRNRNGTSRSRTLRTTEAASTVTARESTLRRALHPRVVIVVPREPRGFAVAADLEHDFLAEALVGSNAPEPVLANLLEPGEVLYRVERRQAKQRDAVFPSDDSHFAGKIRRSLVGAEIPLEIGIGRLRFLGILLGRADCGRDDLVHAVGPELRVHPLRVRHEDGRDLLVRLHQQLGLRSGART